jgi:TRAP-type mannitol/chloroaromatic compound transport system permease large subunit
MEGQLALAMFVAVCAILLLGFPVALTLGGTALGFAALGILIGHFDPDYLTCSHRSCFRHHGKRNAGGRTAIYPDGRRT